MSASDVQVGDLVKFINKQHPEVTFTSRVRKLPAGPYYQSRALGGASLYIEDWDIEVLDRPLPPIDKELLWGAVHAYREADGIKAPTADYHLEPEYYGAPITAVINYLREHDTYNKESK